MVQQDRPVKEGPQDYQAHQVLQGRKDQEALEEMLAPLATMGAQDRKATEGHKDCQAQKAKMG